jgi:lysophospholipase L1-like esterase
MRSILGGRARRLLIAVLATLGLVGLAAPAASASPEHHGPATYLALGDSVPFGYRANLPPVLYQFPRLFVGYPEFVGPTLGLRTLNAACPGESTTSFITGAGSNGCENAVDGGQAYRQHFPLHVRYSGTQLHYALATLESRRDVRLVTLMLGANDVFLCQETTRDHCVSEFPRVLTRVGANVAAILAHLRGVYGGRIVVVTYYALNYKPTDPNLPGTLALDKTITAAAGAVPGVMVADGFAAFRQRALAAGGSSIAAGLVLPNDVHPTLFGQFLLARAVERALGR